MSEGDICAWLALVGLGCTVDSSLCSDSRPYQPQPAIFINLIDNHSMLRKRMNVKIGKTRTRAVAVTK